MAGGPCRPHSRHTHDSNKLKNDACKSSPDWRMVDVVQPSCHLCSTTTSSRRNGNGHNCNVCVEYVVLFTVIITHCVVCLAVYRHYKGEMREYSASGHNSDTIHVRSHSFHSLSNDAP